VIVHAGIKPRWYSGQAEHCTIGLKMPAVSSYFQCADNQVFGVELQWNGTLDIVMILQCVGPRGISMVI